MSFIGDFFHGIGNLLTGHSFGHKDTPQQTQTQAPNTPVIDIPTPAAAAPREAAAPQQGVQGARPNAKSMTPSFLAAATLPNSEGGSLSSNVGGKSLLGQ